MSRTFMSLFFLNLVNYFLNVLKIYSVIVLSGNAFSVTLELTVFNPYKPRIVFVGHRQTVQNQIRCCTVCLLLKFE